MIPAFEESESGEDHAAIMSSGHAYGGRSLALLLLGSIDARGQHPDFTGV